MNMQENGQIVEIPTRQIEIYKIQLEQYTKTTITYTVDCSKGTYIRTLSEDIAKKLGTLGYTSCLIRTSVDSFKIEDSIPIEELNLNSKIITIEEIFQEKENIILDNKKLELFLNGVQLTNIKPDDIYKIYNNNKFIGLRNNKK